MKRFLLVFVTVFALSLSSYASEDFIGLLLNKIEEEGEEHHITPETYNCITVGPAMMEKVLDITDDNDNEHTEQFKKVLPHIKSLRIFYTQQNIPYYTNTIQDILSQNNTKYKSYRACQKQKKSNVWLRKNKDTVVEIIILNKKEGDLKVVNLTGDMTTDFVTELMKM